MIKWNRWKEIEPPKDKEVFVSNNAKNVYGICVYDSAQQRWKMKGSKISLEVRFWSLGEDLIETFSEYQKRARATAVYPEKHQVVYPAFGLASEAGEVCDKIKKAMRGDGETVDPDGIRKELGDVLWYLSILSEDLGFSLQDVAQANIEKLAKRNREGKIKGSGDER